MKAPTFYDFLGIELFSPIEIIKPAYRSKLLSLALGVIKGDKKSEKAIKLLAKWYDKVSDPDMKRAYDRWIVHRYYNFGLYDESSYRKDFDDYWNDIKG